MKTVKCMVSCRNADGEPDFHFVKVNCTKEQYNNGDHYTAAKYSAIKEGYEDIGLVYDENDSAGKALTQLFEWKSASII